MNKKRTPHIFRRIVIPLLLLIFSLIGLRLLWSTYFDVQEPARIEQGLLDLRDGDSGREGLMPLDGEWLFYPEVYYTYEDLAEADQALAQTIQVPGNWKHALPDNQSFGYGTYRLTILLEPGEQELALWVQRLQAAARLEINGEVLAAYGRLGQHAADYVPERTPFLVRFLPDASRLELLIQVANFDDPYTGGILRSLYLGDADILTTQRGISTEQQKFIFLLLVLHSVYTLIMYGFNRQQRGTLIFSLLTLVTALIVVTDHDGLLTHWLPINFTWMVKLKTITYALFSFFLLLFARRLDRSSARSRLFRGYAMALAGYVALIIMAPVGAVYHLMNYRLTDLFYIAPIIVSLAVFIRMAVRRQPDAIYLLIAATSSISSAVWGIIHTVRGGTPEYYPLDMIAAIISFSIFWFRKYFRTLDEVRELNIRLQREDRQKDQFLANTAHELRTPLHGMISLAQQAATKETPQASPDDVQSLHLIVSIGRRMAQLVEDLQDLALIKANRIALRQEWLSVSATISGVIDMLRFMLEDKPIRLTTEIADPQLRVWADERRLVQILFNLLHNAIKFTERGTITMYAGVEGNRVVLRVSDTGVGMREEQLQRIFEPYTQGDVEAQRSQGLGLGLHIVKQLVELHGGSIIASSSLGEGTAFDISLPTPAEQDAGRRHKPAVAPLLIETPDIPQVAATELAASEPEPGEGAAILVVDDDPVNLKVLRKMLEDSAAVLTTVTSAREALVQLEARRWDLLIADVMMPEMSGYALSQAVRQHYSAAELPILLLTARSAAADIYAGFQAGATDYVTKPVDVVELRHRIASLIQLKRSVDERLRIEAAYLQAQIQPHFFLNSLNAIMALGDFDIQRMQRLADALITYLQTSYHFINTKELVPLQHELELSRSYLYIEQERFGDRLQVVWEGDEDLPLQIPPLSIQPLIENAVRHGLLKRIKGGRLCIRIIREGDRATISVIDDGVGMTAAQIEEVLAWPRKSAEGKGIGLSNTNQRLKQLYGQGLRIATQPGEGTTVSFDVLLDA
ncbi:hybrid sensor histidine kinase/response regulator [Paenibacillus sp. 598K]|uniref:hybrid sensor histidine kinase/response regulator n=1 Tax=Paenibacillus sp. 598K TaxID=1117987 RepID=UPI000FFEF025|nr:ATP-binding protein [Paenibacillus sp. 598K]